MKNEMIITAASVEEAIEEALEELEATQEEVDIEVLEEPSKKIFGGFTQAKVKVSLREDILEDDEDTKDGESVEYVEEDESAEEVEDVDDVEEVEQGNVEEPNEEEFIEEDEEAGLPGNFIVDEEELNYNETFKQLTEEELDTIADTAIETIREFLSYFGAADVEIDEYEGDEGELILDIMGDNLAVLIGRHGKNLDALQFLVSSIVSKTTGFRYPIVVDIKGYKHRRKQKIIGIAKASATRAVRQKHDVRLRPMTPYERRIVHVALRDDKRVKTSSDGVEPNRCVIIQLV